VHVVIATGVTHQVRAHLALAGHPIVGDAKYGGPPAPAGTRDGQLLHAQRIVLDDATSFAAPVAADFVRALACLRRDARG
jgi:23S rRNA-/tRNA-specific pseudouridylate synthase